MRDEDDTQQTVIIAKPPELSAIYAEAAALGAMMIDNRVIDNARDRLRREHFYEPVHGRIYHVLLHLRENGDAANPITARAYLENDPALAQLGGAGYLAQLTGSGAVLIGQSTLVDQIIQFWTYRQMREVMRTNIRRLEEGVTGKPGDGFEQYLTHNFPDPAELAADAAAEIVKTTEGTQRIRLTGVHTLLKRVRARHERAVAGISTGAICATVSDLNEVIGPAAPGQMTIIGGRSGMGKTVLACSAAWGYAVNGHPTLLISLEMTEDALAMRLAADLTFGMNEPVPFGDMVRDRLTESQLLQIDEASRRIEQYPFQSVSPGRVTIEQIEGIVARESARLMRLGKKLEVVVVDYIQIVAATGKLEGTQRINHISEGLLRIAQRYDVHVFALSQLLRDIDKRPDRRPTVADLKESGRLEEDADNVVLVYRPEFYLVKEQPDKSRKPKEWEEWNIEYEAARGRADIMGVKVRMGEQQTRRVRFYGKHQAMRGSDYYEADFANDNVLLPDALAGT